MATKLLILRKLKEFIIILASTLLLVELLAQLILFAFPSVDQVVNLHGKLIKQTIPDKVLGHRPNPVIPGHDRLGFRNKSVPESAYVVCLGDSHTYGAGVGEDEAWPRQLQETVRRSVYSMAYGGYGPAHNLLLWDEAVSFKPKIIVATVYSGNDLNDSYNIVYNLEQLQEVRSKNPAVLQRIREENTIQTIEEKVRYLSKRGRKKSKVNTRGLKSFLREYSKTYGIIRALKRLTKVRYLKPKNDLEHWNQVRNKAVRSNGLQQIYEHGKIKTIMTSQYRLAALDSEDPRIDEGKRILFYSIRQMSRLANKQGIYFVVLLIPTKEFAFSSTVRKNGLNLGESYQELVAKEKLFWQDMKRQLEKEDIKYVDAANDFSLMIQRGISPFDFTENGHFNKIGHEAVSKRIAETISTK